MRSIGTVRGLSASIVLESRDIGSRLVCYHEFRSLARGRAPHPPAPNGAGPNPLPRFAEAREYLLPHHEPHDFVAAGFVGFALAGILAAAEHHGAVGSLENVA